MEFIPWYLRKDRSHDLVLISEISLVICVSRYWDNFGRCARNLDTQLLFSIIIEVTF